jgi:hypothetical protein
MNVKQVLIGLATGATFAVVVGVGVAARLDRV